MKRNPTFKNKILQLIFKNRDLNLQMNKAIKQFIKRKLLSLGHFQLL